MPNIKVVIWSAAGAAVIAFIAGLFGRVDFLDLILRTLIGGAAFGLFGAGVSVLLMRFVPEIFEIQEVEEEEFAVASSETKNEGTQAQQGSNLNIVLDGDEYSYAGEAGDDLSSEPGREESALDLEEDEEFVEQVAESGQSANEARGGESQSQSTDYEEFEDLSDVDTLPDLEDFSDSFESVAAAQDSDGQLTGGGGYSSDESVDIMGDQQDPATVAKAVRTIISKDQEG
ncbi:MAG: hypothetical protein ACOC2P_02865 [Spirochaetota bacterium]